ncbi:MAG: glycosyl hydrolase [Candidatus Micrarchaeia archaeon]
MKIKHVALIAVMLVILAFVLFALPNGKTSSLPKRLNFTLGLCTHGNESSELYALRHGVRYLRTDISLTKSQEALIGMEHSSYNASYLGILDYETLPGGSSNKNWSLEEWNESVANAIRSYPYITTWEIWNEPYIKSFQTGYMNGSAYNYYRVIKNSYEIIKSVEPNATIVCFGGAPLGVGNIYDWYAQVWNYGAYNYCNAISIHAYPDSYGLNNAINATWANSLMEYEDLTGKPIWITEFGMPSSSTAYPYSMNMQRNFLIQSLDFFDRFRFVKRAYWYDLWGLSDGTYKNNFGLLNLSDPNSNITSPAWHVFLYEYFNAST